MQIFKTLILFSSFLICVNGFVKNYYFIDNEKTQPNTDEDWSSKEQEFVALQKEESNENNDFKFDDQSYKDSEEEEKDAANQLYQFWNNLDMCNDVNCKDDQICIMNKENVAICVDKSNLKLVDNGNFTSYLSYLSSQRIKRCNECPKLDMNDIYCASNNQSYTSLCELIKYNCEHLTNYYPLCQDECPCNKNINLNKKLKLDYLWKYVNNFQSLSQLTMEKFNNDSKLQQNKSNRIKLNSRLSFMSISGTTKSEKKNRKCSAKELNDMGQRLFNWFGVILKNQLNNKDLRSTKILKKIRSSEVDCNEEVNFMFLNLDTNRDLKLSLDELYHLGHDQREKCLKAYIDSCDTNKDQILNGNEWCNCFNQYRPCIKERNNLSLNNKFNKLSVNYIPNCNRNGYFNPLQCNKFIKFCWCVDKNGIEIVNTRKLGKVVCADKANVNKNMHPIDDDSEIDGDDDFEDYQEENEGSGEN